MAQNEPQRKETPPGPSPNSLSVSGSQQRSTVWSVFAINDETSRCLCQLNRIETFFAGIGMVYHLLHVSQGDNN